MKNLLKSFVCGEEGFLLSTEGVLVGTIAIVGLIAGIVAIRDAVVLELEDFAVAVADLDQSYLYSGVIDATASASTQGGEFVDAADDGDPAAIEVTTTGNDGEAT
jgi:hypothetical protein